MNRELLPPVLISYLHSNQLDLEFDRCWIEFWFAQVMFTFLERKEFKSAPKDSVQSHTEEPVLETPGHWLQHK